MPKIVDHEERRRAIAEAMWRLIAREGVGAASARSVALEGGWSLGAVRHYFSTQDELVRFAVETMVADVEHRVTSILTGRRPGVGRCQLVLEELLPLDHTRLGEIRAWLALVVRAPVDPLLDDLRRSMWESERQLCRFVVAELTGRPTPADGRRLPRPAEAQTAALHAFVDGLTLQAITVPHEFPPAAQRRALRAQLRALAPRDTG